MFGANKNLEYSKTVYNDHSYNEFTFKTNKILLVSMSQCQVKKLIITVIANRYLWLAGPRDFDITKFDCRRQNSAIQKLGENILSHLTKLFESFYGKKNYHHIIFQSHTNKAKLENSIGKTPFKVEAKKFCKAWRNATTAAQEHNNNNSNKLCKTSTTTTTNQHYNTNNNNINEPTLQQQQHQQQQIVKEKSCAKDRQQQQQQLLHLIEVAHSRSRAETFSSSSLLDLTLKLFPSTISYSTTTTTTTTANT